MSKAVTRESDAEGDDHDHAADEAAHADLAGGKNYITPSGLQRLRDELRFLLTRERPAVTQVVAWAAGNGDRSENADYQYGKRRLREIDRRIRFLAKRIDAAAVVDPEAPREGRAATQVFFGATVRYANAAGTEKVVSVVGLDEIDLNRNHISWRSPLARALMKSGPGDSVVLRAPGGAERLQILEVRYERIAVAPFSEPPGAEAAPTTRPRAEETDPHRAAGPSVSPKEEVLKRRFRQESDL
jgi:transcription elongation factor GreB